MSFPARIALSLLLVVAVTPATPVLAGTAEFGTSQGQLVVDITTTDDGYYGGFQLNGTESMLIEVSGDDVIVFFDDLGASWYHYDAGSGQLSLEHSTVPQNQCSAIAAEPVHQAIGEVASAVTSLGFPAGSEIPAALQLFASRDHVADCLDFDFDPVTTNTVFAFCLQTAARFGMLCDLDPLQTNCFQREYDVYRACQDVVSDIGGVTYFACTVCQNPYF